MMSIMLAIGGFFGLVDKEEVPIEPDPVINIIYMIGDGMGYNHIAKTKAEQSVSLAMDTFPVNGSSMTQSLSSSVTDSAAGGTALATGSRTGNGMIGVYYEDPDIEVSYPKNLTELCKENGMMTGVITTDSTSGATPASFSAHSSDRDNTEDITEDQLRSSIDIVWGKANGLVTQSIAEENGFYYVETYEDMMALPEGSRSFAQFNDSLWKASAVNDSPTLEQMAIKAVDIMDDTDDGFFLMIEGAHIDKHSHNKDADKMMEALLSFDKTVQAMLDYAKADGNTIVIVTADHETGGITFENDAYVYTKSSHTAADVPVLVYGTQDIIAADETLNNYEIPIRIAYVLGFDETQFPVSIAK